MRPGQRQPETGRDRRREQRRGVEIVGGDVAVRPLVGERPEIDPHETAQAAAVVGAVGAGRQVDGPHQVGVDRRAEAADVVERRDLDAVDVDLGLVGRRAPDDELTRAERRAGHAGEVLHHLQRVPLGAGDPPRLLGADPRLDRLLLDARRAHDGGVVDPSLSSSPRARYLTVRRLPTAMVSSVVDRDEAGVGELDLVRAGRDVE